MKPAIVLRYLLKGRKVKLREGVVLYVDARDKVVSDSQLTEVKIMCACLNTFIEKANLLSDKDINNLVEKPDEEADE